MDASSCYLLTRGLDLLPFVWSKFVAICDLNAVMEDNILQLFPFNVSLYNVIKLTQFNRLKVIVGRTKCA